MILKLIKLPFKVVAVALVPALMILHFTGAIVLGLSSTFTNLLASLFLFGSIARWIMHEQTAMLVQTLGIGFFFALAPHIGEWLLSKLTDITTALLEFIFS